MKPVDFGSSFTFVAFSQGLGSATEGETLQVFELPDGFVMNVPISALAVTIPKKELKNNVVKGSKMNPRYFLFQHERRPDISVSGWIEKAERFTSTRKIWQDDTIQWQINGLPEPDSVEFRKIGGWDAVLYDLKIADTVHSNIRAHWIQENTWVDIHITAIAAPKSPKQTRATLLKMLERVHVENTNETLG